VFENDRYVYVWDFSYLFVRPRVSLSIYSNTAGSLFHFTWICMCSAIHRRQAMKSVRLANTEYM
jgi:hypothetical protein